MFESTTSEMTRNAMQIAHEERAIAFRQFWAWMLNRFNEPALRTTQASATQVAAHPNM